jgi:hypothetical protein
MDEHIPPRRADREVATNRPRKTENAAAPIAEFPELRNNRIVEVRRCLTDDWWLWLEWTASNTGYIPPEFVAIDVLKGGMIYGAR